MRVYYKDKYWHAGMTEDMHLRNKNLRYANEFEDILDQVKIDLSRIYSDNEVIVITVDTLPGQVYWIRVNEIIEWLDLPFIDKRMFLLI